MDPDDRSNILIILQIFEFLHEKRAVCVIGSGSKDSINQPD